MESTDLSADELRAELRHHRALRNICEEAGEIAGHDVYASTARAIAAKLDELGESYPAE